jgi:hypothetical protein
MPASEAPQSEPGSSRKGLLRDIGVNAVLPYVTYLVLTRQGVPTVPALVAGAVFPASAAIITIVRERRIAALGLIVLAATAASVAGALWFTDPFLLLAKGSFVTGDIGLVFLASLALRRPLVFHLATTGKDATARQRSESLWQTEPAFRAVMRRLTAIWAVALLAEATLRLVMIPLMPIAVFLPISEAMWIVFFAAMMAWSWRYGTRMRTALQPAPST